MLTLVCVNLVWAYNVCIQVCNFLGTRIYISKNVIPTVLNLNFGTFYIYCNGNTSVLLHLLVSDQLVNLKEFISENTSSEWFNPIDGEDRDETECGQVDQQYA